MSHPTALDQFVTLGRSGLRVSPLCLGTMTFGLDWGWGSSPDDSTAILRAYLDAGGNFLDTANIYTKGHSEVIIGEHLGDHTGRRDRAVIATKFFGNLYPGDPNAGGGSRKNMIASCEHSLRRLRTEYIDLYWLHCWDAFTPIEETMRGMDDLVRSGKVRYIGFSDTPAWVLAGAQSAAHFRGWAPLVALQIEYSLVERTVEGELIPAAQHYGLGVTPWSPLKGGVLTGKYTRKNIETVEPSRGQWVKNAFNERVFTIIDVLIEVARDAGCTPAQAALAWVNRRPGVASSIIGARTMEQLTDNLAALKVHLTAAQADRLEAASKPALNFPYDFVNRAAPFMQGGTTVNGRPSETWPLAPQNDEERW